LANKTGNIGFGNLTGLRPVNTTSTVEIEDQEDEDNENTTITNQYTDFNTKIMKITNNTYLRLKDHSRKYYDIESYDTIIKDLLDCYGKHNDQKNGFNYNLINYNIFQ
jgi:hypothetical protein